MRIVVSQALQSTSGFCTVSPIRGQGTYMIRLRVDFGGTFTDVALENATYDLAKLVDAVRKGRGVV